MNSFSVLVMVAMVVVLDTIEGLITLLDLLISYSLGVLSPSIFSLFSAQISLKVAKIGHVNILHAILAIPWVDLPALSDDSSVFLLHKLAVNPCQTWKPWAVWLAIKSWLIIFLKEIHFSSLLESLQRYFRFNEFSLKHPHLVAQSNDLLIPSHYHALVPNRRVHSAW